MMPDPRRKFCTKKKSFEEGRWTDSGRTADWTRETSRYEGSWTDRILQHSISFRWTARIVGIRSGWSPAMVYRDSRPPHPGTHNVRHISSNCDYEKSELFGWRHNRWKIASPERLRFITTRMAFLACYTSIPWPSMISTFPLSSHCLETMLISHVLARWVNRTEWRGNRLRTHVELLSFKTEGTSSYFGITGSFSG